MRVAFLHTHVIEDLGRFGISRESYPRHFGYEHKYARLFNKGPWKSRLLIFSRSVDDVEVYGHVWGHEIVLIPLRGIKGVRYLSSARALVKVLRDFDLVHCFSYYSNIFDFVAPLCRLLGIPLVAQAQGIYPSLGIKVWMRKIFTLRMADRLLPLNSSEAEFLRKKFRIDASRVKVVPNFIEPDDYEFFPRDAARRAIGVGDDEFVVLTVCRLVPEKGVQTLLRAAAQLRDIPGLRVMVVGEGPYRRELEGLARELGLEGVVRFEGWVHGSRVGAYYSAADCFVLASSEESFGIVLVEALLYGLPVVASETWGAREVLGRGVPRLLFPAGDDTALAGLIRRLYAEPSIREIFEKAGRSLALENFGPDQVYRRLDRVYRDVLAGRVGKKP